MSMTNITTWAVDLKDIGAIYPMVGTEVILTIIGVVLWIGWHIWQIKHEDSHYKEEIKAHGSVDNLKKASSSDL